MKTYLLALFLIFFPLISWSQETTSSFSKSLTNYKIILVKSRKFHSNTIFHPDYEEHKNLFQDLNLQEYFHFEIIETDGAEAPEYASRDIVKAIRDSRYKVILWAYDKASADVLDALLSYPLLQNKVVAFVNVQGGIQGATEAKKSKPIVPIETSQIAAQMPLFQGIRYWIDYLYTYIDKKSSSLYSFHPQVRRKYLMDHKEGIKKLNKKVKVISLGLKADPYFIIPGSHIVYNSKKIITDQERKENIFHLVQYALNGNRQ